MFSCEVLTLFPQMIAPYVGESILGKAIEKQVLGVRVTNIRDFAVGKHKVTDDVPYGGGAGMVMKPEPLVAAIEAAKTRLPDACVIVMSPRGAPFTQKKAHQLSTHAGGLVLVCGRYEGIDERVLKYVDEEVSLGDFVLTGGEIAALAVIDAVARLVPGVLGNAESSTTESFESSLLEFPQYTRPPEFRGALVPDVLQGGNHALIARWRRWWSLKLTHARRPDLLASAQLTAADQALLKLEEPPQK